MWFSPDIGGYNGYYDGEHIQMRDFPVLAHAANPPDQRRLPLPPTNLVMPWTFAIDRIQMKTLCGHGPMAGI